MGTGPGNARSAAAAICAQGRVADHRPSPLLTPLPQGRLGVAGLELKLLHGAVDAAVRRE